MPLRLVTDSTCDLPQEVVERLNIIVVPCNVHFGHQLLRDGVDIRPDELYERLASGGVYPTTSQPSVGTFVEVYRRLREEGSEVLSLHVSSKMSGTVNSAAQAKEHLNDEAGRLEVVDSLQVSLGLGMMATAVARMAQEGAKLDDALQFLSREAGNFQSFCSVDTLDYLVRGGRASRLQGFFASLLDIKPIIQVREGETHPVERVRSRRRVLARLHQIVETAPEVRSIGVIHSACRDEAEALAAACHKARPEAEVLVSQFGAVMGVHLGPRALGVAVWTGHSRTV